MAGVTLQTIADRVGVSRMTVSNAFSRPDQLSAELRERILAAAESMGYSGPDPAARALARGTTGAVGLLLTDSIGYAFTDQAATAFVGAIADELAPTGSALTLLLSNAGQADVVPARDVPMDGAIVFSCDRTSDAVNWLVRRRLPMVFVDQQPMPGISSVNVDDRGGARAAAQHLLGLGHRRIGIVFASFAGPHGLVQMPLSNLTGHSTVERLDGWVEVLHAAGLEPPVVSSPRSDPAAGAAAAEILLDITPRPTAVLCFSDAIAAGVIDAARARGLRVPEDLSVVGFDDSPNAEHLRPPLTTVRQDLHAKGRQAVAVLLTAMERSRRRQPAARARRVVLPTELVVRASTGPPPVDDQTGATS